MRSSSPAAAGAGRCRVRVWHVRGGTAMLNVEKRGPGMERGGEATCGRGARRQTRDGVAMPLLSRQSVAGACWPGRCGPPFDQWRIWACSGDQVEADECWIPAKTDPIKLSIVLIGGIHIFIGETVDSDGNALVSHADATAAEQDAVAKIRSETQELLKEDSAWVSQVLEKPRCHFVHFLAHTAGTAPPQEGAGPMQVEATGDSDAPDQQEAAGDSDAPDQQEDVGDKEESILGNLSPTSDDATTMDTEEYNRLPKELEDSATAEAESAPPKQVIATITGLEQGSDEETTPTDAGLPGPSNSETPPSRPRYRVVPDSREERILEHGENMSTEELVEEAGRGAIAHSEILTKPITPDDAIDPEALEAKRKEMLATAKVFANTAVAMLEERQEAEEVMESFLKREREAVEYLEEAKALRARWETIMEEAGKEVDRIRREAIGPRKINFATPTNQQPLATPKDNMKKAAEILAKNNEEIDIAHLRTLASVMKQQSKTDTSRRLESNPELCVSTAQKNASGREHRDDESRTRSTERRRRTREHPNPIPVPSKITPTDPNKGKDPMYTGRDKYRNPSPPPRHPRPPPPPRRRSPAGNTRPHGLGGINIRDNAAPQRNRNTERTPDPRRSRNEEREPEPRRSRNEGGDRHHGEGSHRSRSQQQKGVENLKAEAKGPTIPLADLPPHHLVEEVEAEVEAGDLAPVQNPPATARATQGNHYDGSERPDTWIEDYFNAVSFTRGNQKIACRMLQLYLIGPAHTWLSDLPENSIFCWFDLKIAFEKHFRGTYKRPATTSDLQACIQKKGETSRNFLTRWLATRNECENVDNRTAMHAFIGGLQRGGLLRHKLTCLINENNLTLDDMIGIASTHTATDDDASGELTATAIPLH
ncbi:hypothetical protein QYE76_037990 [Lolium multiflorum]|uniref:Retrotransposon gag domain-containing protein n=1 Tax=Lolium multiflorum TaxID=4521 RepID=A0AAD8T7X3_LOLMU|nr:hypothetical protein QYE76_037990 [Lolium multiflorum]